MALDSTSGRIIPTRLENGTAQTHTYTGMYTYRCAYIYVSYAYEYLGSIRIPISMACMYVESPRA